MRLWLFGVLTPLARPDAHSGLLRVAPPPKAEPRRRRGVRPERLGRGLPPQCPQLIRSGPAALPRRRRRGRARPPPARGYPPAGGAPAPRHAARPDDASVGH